MPLLSRTFIKAALIYFLAALVMGVMLAARSLVSLPAAIGGLSPVYFHLFMVGWVTQLIFGIAYWMFPKYSRERPRGSESLAWAVFFLLNGGLLLRALSEPMNALHPQTMWGWLLALSAVLQWLAGLAFVVNTWGRVKEK